jgi:hypothetical protein
MSPSTLTTSLALPLTTLALTFAPLAARAQDEPSSPTIEVGSSRIGGPGTADEQRAEARAEAAEEEVYTEETLPPRDSKKRLPALLTLARQYSGGKLWREACGKYDAVIEEAGEGALDEDARARAAQSYFGCAKDSVAAGEHEKAEALLARSERFAPGTAKHEALREKMLRDRYKKKLADGDVSGAIALFEKAQAMRLDEDERIRMGEELAKRANLAFQARDKVELDLLVAKLEAIAPLNTDYRRLKDRMAAGDSAFERVFGLGIAALVLAGGLTLLMRWRAAARVKRMSGAALDDF